MGNHIGIEACNLDKIRSNPLFDDDLGNTQPLFHNIIFGWRYYIDSNDDLFVRSDPIILQEFTEFQSQSCYIILHLFLSPEIKNKTCRERTNSESSAEPNISAPILALSAKEKLIEKDQISFRIHSSTSSNGDLVQYEIHLWKGNEASHLVKANTEAQGLDLGNTLKDLDRKILLSSFYKESSILPLSSIIKPIEDFEEWEKITEGNCLFRFLYKPNQRKKKNTRSKKKSRRKESEYSKSKPINTAGGLSRSRISRKTSRTEKRSNSQQVNTTMEPSKHPDSKVTRLTSKEKLTYRSLSLPSSQIQKAKGGMKSFKIDLSDLSLSEDSNTDKFLPPESKATKIARCDKICSPITNSLFLGSDTIAKDSNLLKRQGITHVLNCAGTICDNYYPNEFTYKKLHLFDGSKEDIACLFYDVLEFLDDAISSNGKVFVHCHQGISRSSAMLILYLMWKEHADYQETHERVKAIREVANPNAGFTCQLLNWQRLRESKERPSCIFAVFPHCEQDPEQFIMKHVNPTGDLSLTLLDSRGCFIIWTSKKLFLWIGNECTSILEEQGLLYAKRLQKFEKAAKPRREVQGKESKKFLSLFPNPNVAVQQVESYTQHYDLLKRNE